MSIREGQLWPPFFDATKPKSLSLTLSNIRFKKKDHTMAHNTIDIGRFTLYASRRLVELHAFPEEEIQRLCSDAAGKEEERLQIAKQSFDEESWKALCPDGTFAYSEKLLRLLVVEHMQEEYTRLTGLTTEGAQVRVGLWRIVHLAIDYFSTLIKDAIANRRRSSMPTGSTPAPVFVEEPKLQNFVSSNGMGENVHLIGNNVRINGMGNHCQVIAYSALTIAGAGNYVCAYILPATLVKNSGMGNTVNTNVCTRTELDTRVQQGF